MLPFVAVYCMYIFVTGESGNRTLYSIIGFYLPCALSVVTVFFFSILYFP